MIRGGDFFHFLKCMIFVVYGKLGFGIWELKD